MADGGYGGQQQYGGDNQWNVKVKIEALDRGNVQVKNRWVVNDTLTVQIEGHATINMLKQRVALLVAAHSKDQTMKTTDGKVLGDNDKLEDVISKENAMVMLVVAQPKEAVLPDVVLSDDEDLWNANDEAENEASTALPDEAGMKKELTDDEQDKQNALKQAGAELLEDGDKAAALAKYTEAIMIGAPTAMILCKRAEIALKLKRPKSTIADATAALAINPDSAKAFKLRGKARRFLGDYENADADLNQAQKIDFDDDVADLHAYVKKRWAKLQLKAKQDEKKAKEAEEKSGGDVSMDDPDAPKGEGEITYGAPTPEKLKSEKMEKKMKKVQKEGGKRGVEIEGAADMGGLQFFCTSVLEPGGDVDLLYECLQAMNAKNEPGEEERKGGSAHVGKMIISTNQESTTLALVTYVPPSKQSQLTADVWMKDVLAALGVTGNVSFADATSAKAVVENDPAKEVFVLKVKDAAIMQSIEYLKKKGLFPDKPDDDSDDDMVFGDDDFPA